MRIQLIACALIALGCSSEIAERPVASDPTNAASAEAPYRCPAPYEPDSLLGASAPKSKAQPAESYTCPMHPEINQSQPGQCPKCGMTLVPRKPEAR